MLCGMVQKTPHDLDSSHINLKLGVISKIKKVKTNVEWWNENYNLWFFLKISSLTEPFKKNFIFYNVDLFNNFVKLKHKFVYLSLSSPFAMKSYMWDSLSSITFNAIKKNQMISMQVKNQNTSLRFKVSWNIQQHCSRLAIRQKTLCLQCDGDLTIYKIYW